MGSDDSVRRVRVDLGERSYEVSVGRGVRHLVGASLPPGTRRVALVTQEGVPAELRPDIPEVPVSLHVIPQGEKHKTLSTVETLCREFSRAGLTRADAVVSVGGGLVSDVAGFAAACYHRGTPVVHVPTTLLGMVDAAIGGKTGVNLPEGKNLVGAFWQPAAVLCDLDALDSLPERETRCGSGEMAKYHFITGDDLAAMSLGERIARCVGIKANIVAEDEREGGRRALLNYGHTLAHALETVTEHRIAHGEAVSHEYEFDLKRLGPSGSDQLATRWVPLRAHVDCSCGTTELLLRKADGSERRLDGRPDPEFAVADDERLLVRLTINTITKDPVDLPHATSRGYLLLQPVGDRDGSRRVQWPFLVDFGIDSPVDCRPLASLEFGRVAQSARPELTITLTGAVACALASAGLAASDRRWKAGK